MPIPARKPNSRLRCNKEIATVSIPVQFRKTLILVAARLQEFHFRESQEYLLL